MRRQVFQLQPAAILAQRVFDGKEQPGASRVIKARFTPFLIKCDRLLRRRHLTRGRCIEPDRQDQRREQGAEREGERNADEGR